MPLNPIDGDDDPNLIYAGSTHDQITALGGNDTVYAGDGKDLIYGGDDDDQLFGGYGGDRVFGGAGNDVLRGDWGEDRLYGGAGDDSFAAYAGSGNDTVYGGDGNDTAYWGTADSGVFHGGKGLDHFAFYNASFAGPLSVDISSGSGTLVQDGIVITLTSVEKLTVYGGTGDETVTGGRFKDQIQVYSGANVVDAGAGNDNVVYTAGAANTLEGGAGTDTLFVGTDYYSALEFNADGPTVTDGFGSSITGFEKFQVYGGVQYDSITGGGAADRLYGNRGGDNLHGKGGNDWLYGQGEDDALYGGNGNDTLSGGADLDVLTGGDGADAFLFAVADGNGDVVADFVTGQDELRVFGAAFGISSSETVVLSVDAAVGTGGQFVYNSVSGDLIWDANGTDTGGDRIIAVLIGAVAVDVDDILVY